MFRRPILQFRRQFKRQVSGLARRAATGLGVTVDRLRQRLRSLRRGKPSPAEVARQDLLRRWVAPGALVFDLGANIGEMSDVFRTLQARVIAVEPHPACVATLRGRFGAMDSAPRNGDVAVVDCAISAQEGTATLHLGTMTEISTLSTEFQTAYGDGADVSWPTTRRVRTTTFDALIACHGLPDFAKLDLEGHEAAALAGLSRPVAALSIEYNARLRQQAVACVERLVEITEHGTTEHGTTEHGTTAPDTATYEWNFSPYEHYTLALPTWLSAADMCTWLMDLPATMQTGDLYAQLRR